MLRSRSRLSVVSVSKITVTLNQDEPEPPFLRNESSLKSSDDGHKTQPQRGYLKAGRLKMATLTTWNATSPNDHSKLPVCLAMRAKIKGPTT